ncbi:MAG: site-specific integrase, partial [Deltaproteobacteria bacterium]
MIKSVIKRFSGREPKGLNVAPKFLNVSPEVPARVITYLIPLGGWCEAMAKKILDLPQAKFHPTDYPGVLYLESAARSPDGKLERTYYIRYRTPDHRQHFEKVGRQFDKIRMTPAKASGIRAERSRGNELPNEDRREAERAEAQAEAERWTFSKLWEEYKAGRPGMKRSATDQSNFTNYILPAFGDKEPREVAPLDVDRLRLTLSKKKTPGTVKNVLELLRRLSNFAANKQLCDPLPFRVSMPKTNNLKTEDLNAEQMARLLTVLRDGVVVDKDGKKTQLDPDAREIMFLAMFTGMRRGEIFRLKWEDVDFRRGFIAIREPKGGSDQTIPLPEGARDLLEHRPRRKDSPYIFPGRGGQLKKDASKQFRAIRAAADLPSDFRPMHGLRHVFASMLASSGEVD